MTKQKMIALTQKKDEVLAKIAQLGPMRRGSLVSIYRKCGKPNCHCAVPGSPGHGPSWILTRSGPGGKTVTKGIKDGQAYERTKEHVDRYKLYRQLSDELIEINEKICNLELEGIKADENSAKKGALPAP